MPSAPSNRVRIDGEGVVVVSAVKDFRVNLEPHHSQRRKTATALIKITMELEDTGDVFLHALREYRDGRQSVHDVMELVRAYRGRCDHLLWDAREPAYDFLPYVYDCFDHLSELLQAVVSDDPDFPLIESRDVKERLRRACTSHRLAHLRKRSKGVIRTSTARLSTCFGSLLSRG
jgi:hypothetical protein